MTGKRVRFSYEEPEDEEEAKNGPRKLRFPKGKKDGSSSSNLEEGEAVPDARVAANKRALRRSGVELRNAEDASDIKDVADAEEEFEDDEEAEAPLEPFNLKAERRDGYFDDDGHYVEYATKYEARDAWLDSAVVDTRFANQLEQVDEEPAALSSDDIAEMKRRIAELLEPGETVLEALRRLKGSNDRGSGRRPKLTGHAKVAFDQLTENAMKLMDAGETDVYEKARESFQREADMFKPKAGSLDMFGDDEDEESKKLAPEATTSSAAPPTKTTATAAATTASSEGSDSGYVYDDSSGYYYNADAGYYYDPASGLYCSASSGQWFKFDEEKNAYVEAV